MGIYRVNENELGFAMAGNRIWKMHKVSNGHRLHVDVGDWLEYDITANQWTMSIGSSNELLLGATGFKVPNVYTQSGSTANVVVASDGGLTRITSLRAAKKNISYQAADELAAVTLRPVRFAWKGTGEQSFGFIAEDLAVESDRLAVYDLDGELENYDNRGVLAVLAAKVNRLEEELAALKEAA
jgi:hypothetical protein